MTSYSGHINVATSYDLLMTWTWRQVRSHFQTSFSWRRYDVFIMSFCKTSFYNVHMTSSQRLKNENKWKFLGQSDVYIAGSSDCDAMGKHLFTLHNVITVWKKLAWTQVFRVSIFLPKNSFLVVEFKFKTVLAHLCLLEKHLHCIPFLLLITSCSS